MGKRGRGQILHTMCDGEAVKLPGPVTSAVKNPAGDQLGLVLGAGCSMDAPTNLETAKHYSRVAYRELVAAGVINDGCCDENDLGALADSVFAERGTQKPLVDILRPRLVNAPPNDGHKVAAALLAENIVGLILTLNFDRALDSAISTISGGGVTIVHEPEDLGGKTRRALIYLHGDVESNCEKWVLRKAQIEASWEDTWQEFIAHDFALTPNVVFAGLGSPTPVISETVTKVRDVLPSKGGVFQVDAMPRVQNKLATALKVDDDTYIVACWTGFMNAIGAVVARNFIDKIRDRQADFCEDNHFEEENLRPVLGTLPTDILKAGKLRAAWFFDKSEYKTFCDTELDLMVDLILTLAMAIRIVGATECVLMEDGVELRRDGRVVFRVFSRSGSGRMHWSSFDEKLQARLQDFRKYDATTTVIFLTTGVEIVDSPVPDKLVPPVNPLTVMATPPDYKVLSSRMLRDDPKQLTEMVKT